MTEKKGLVPIVTEDTRMSVLTDRLNNKDYLHGIFERLGQDNPIVQDFLVHMAATSNDAEYTMNVGLMLYSLIERQAEADKK